MRKVKLFEASRSGDRTSSSNFYVSKMKKLAQTSFFVGELDSQAVNRAQLVFYPRWEKPLQDPETYSLFDIHISHE